MEAASDVARRPVKSAAILKKCMLDCAVVLEGAKGRSRCCVIK